MKTCNRTPPLAREATHEASGWWFLSVIYLWIQDPLAALHRWQRRLRHSASAAATGCLERKLRRNHLPRRSAGARLTFCPPQKGRPMAQAKGTASSTVCAHTDVVPRKRDMPFRAVRKSVATTRPRTHEIARTCHPSCLIRQAQDPHVRPRPTSKILEKKSLPSN